MTDPNALLALPVGERPQAVIYQAGTNDDAASFSAVTSYGNIRTTCQKIVEGLGIPVFLSTVLPRGNSANVGSRITAGANVARVVELNDRLTGNGFRTVLLVDFDARNGGRLARWQHRDGIAHAE